MVAPQYWPDYTPHAISRRLFHPFHRPLPCSDKELVLKVFLDLSSACRVNICTVALAMGLDCPEVHHVIHSGVPATVEFYYQESGRCGRDGVADDTEEVYPARQSMSFCPSQGNNGSGVSPQDRGFPITPRSLTFEIGTYRADVGVLSSGSERAVAPSGSNLI